LIDNLIIINLRVLSVMENYDDDMDFNAEQVRNMAQQAVELVMGSDNIVY